MWVNQAGAGHWSCWAPGREHSTAHSYPHLRWPLWLSAYCHFLLPIPDPQQPLRGLLLCALRDFFFQFLHFNCMSSISKGWMFWDNKIFPQVMLLSLPLDSSINRKLLVSRRKLSWFLYSLNLFPLKPLGNLLFIFQGYKTKPDAIRQRSAHILSHDQGLGSLVKSFITATLKFITK